MDQPEVCAGVAGSENLDMQVDPEKSNPDLMNKDFIIDGVTHEATKNFDDIQTDKANEDSAIVKANNELVMLLGEVISFDHNFRDRPDDLRLRPGSTQSAKSQSPRRRYVLLKRCQRHDGLASALPAGNIYSFTHR